MAFLDNKYLCVTGTFSPTRQFNSHCAATDCTNIILPTICLGMVARLLLHPQPSDNCRAPVCYFWRTQGRRSLSRQTGRRHWQHFGRCPPASDCFVEKM